MRDLRRNPPSVLPAWIAVTGILVAAGCSRPSAVPAPISAETPSVAANDTSCLPASVAERLTRVQQKAAAREPLAANTKVTPSAANFARLLEFERQFLELAQTTLDSVLPCKDVPAGELEALRGQVKAAQDRVLYLRESLPAAGQN